MRKRVLFFAVLLLATVQLFADETTRRAQEELRKRNLYFGDINGQTNPEFTEALKHYQTRKGFTSTGKLDEETAGSLNLGIATVSNTEALPDLPVLKSDRARELAEPDRAALPDSGQEEPTSSATPPAPPAESPDQMLEDKITKFVRDYLRDGEGDDVDLQLSYYGFPIQYFDHGKAGREFVTTDTRNYIKRWPQRKYELIGPVKFMSGKNRGEFEVEFTIDFKVASGDRRAHGKTRNLWTIQEDREHFIILMINEQRLHD